MKIEKTAKIELNARKKLFYFDSARNALKEILEHYGERELLLPGYIGFSPNEGSGIYDPVVETEIDHQFYKMDRNLQIDEFDLEMKLKHGTKSKIVLLVHYFGYADNKIEDIVNLCRTYGAIVIEDAAHALYTDFIDHKCGLYGDFIFYSLHKMLPMKEGGLLKVNNNQLWFVCKNPSNTHYPLFDYDLYEIAQIRKKNARIWSKLLEDQNGVEIMRPDAANNTPQTFPIIVKDYDRNQLYFKLNELGFGAVSLYHTMIAPIYEGNLEEAIYVSQHIINLPVHQDVKEEEIRDMCKALLSIIND